MVPRAAQVEPGGLVREHLFGTIRPRNVEALREPRIVRIGSEPVAVSVDLDRLGPGGAGRGREGTVVVETVGDRRHPHLAIAEDEPRVVLARPGRAVAVHVEAPRPGHPRPLHPLIEVVTLRVGRQVERPRRIGIGQPGPRIVVQVRQEVGRGQECRVDGERLAHRGAEAAIAGPDRIDAIDGDPVLGAERLIASQQDHRAVVEVVPVVVFAAVAQRLPGRHQIHDHRPDRMIGRLQVEKVEPAPAERLGSSAIVECRDRMDHERIRLLRGGWRQIGQRQMIELDRLTEDLQPVRGEVDRHVERIGQLDGDDRRAQLGAFHDDAVPGVRVRIAIDVGVRHRHRPVHVTHEGLDEERLRLEPEEGDRAVALRRILDPRR